MKLKKNRHEKTKKTAKEIILQIFEKDTKKLPSLKELYESHGINPEYVAKEALKHGKEIKIPSDFYSSITHKSEVRKKEEDKIDLPETKKLYYDEPNETKFKAEVLKIEKNNVVLDKTLFYPEGGGQESDIGNIMSCRVLKVKKLDDVIFHEMEDINFKEGDIIIGSIDEDRRKQLTIHHTCVHIINGLARKILGSHVWQNGTKKSEKNATLDLTHYKIPDKKIIQNIEDEANKVIKKKIKTIKHFMERSEAEKKFGIEIYQGGAIPRKDLRIQEIPGVDVEACGGTHLENTGDIGKLLITNTKKIQDGVIRFTIKGGEAAYIYEKKINKIYNEVVEILGSENIVEESKNLFGEFKRKRNKISSTVNPKEIKNEIEKGNKIKIINGNMKDITKLSKMFKDNDIIFFGSKDSSVVVSMNKNSLKVLLKILDDLGGKGGGSEIFAQGFFNKSVTEDYIKNLEID